MTKDKRPELEINGEVFEFAEPTVWQMEIISDLLHESRKEILSSLAESPKQLARYTIKVSDLLHELRRRRKLSEFVAACMVKKGAVFSEEGFRKNISTFKSMSYEAAESVVEFFFISGIFKRLLIPSFLEPAGAAKPAAATAKGKSKK